MAIIMETMFVPMHAQAGQNNNMRIPIVSHSTVVLCIQVNKKFRKFEV